MNDDARLIKAALDRRFARAATSPCPDGAWHAGTAAPATIVGRNGVFRGLAYAAALIGVLSIGGLAAQASGSVNFRDLPVLRLWASSKPLPPLIHRADRLTIAEAQRRMPFSIVVPTGLPAGTHLRYAHVLSEHPTPRVALAYEAKIANKYYMVNVMETTGDAGPPVAHIEIRRRGHPAKAWNLPLHRWKHGNVVMDLFAPGLPAAMTDRIVRSNTL
jgi:hypothetical protein